MLKYRYQLLPSGGQSTGLLNGLGNLRLGIGCSMKNKLYSWYKSVIHKPVSFRDHLIFPGLPIGVFAVLAPMAAMCTVISFLVYEIVEELRMARDNKHSTDKAYEDIQGVILGIPVGALVVVVAYNVCV